MDILIYLSLLFQFCVILTNAQRIAPGVPPQHYQQQYQQVPQQQYGQQVQYQQQQVPQQVQQQVPIQQQQQQMPVQQQQQIPVQQQQQIPVQQQVPIQQQIPVQQQVPVQQQIPVDKLPAHQRQAYRQGHVLNAANVAQEAQHIAEHMEVPIDTSKMTEQELQFHYFKMHDADNNNKLDGCELIKSLIHWHGKGGDEKHESLTDEELEELVDAILKEADTNNDGFISYAEYRKHSINQQIKT